MAARSRARHSEPQVKPVPPEPDREPVVAEAKPQLEQPELPVPDREQVIAEAKAELRVALRYRRRVRTPAERAAADAARQEAVIGLLDPASRAGELGMIAIYLSRREEPETHALIAWAAAHQVPTLLPMVSAGAPKRARYAGPEQLRAAAHGINEPIGRPLGARALAGADVIICPALAATRTGIRLGEGAGWYDQALGHARPDAVTAVLVDDDEVLATLPIAPHDVRIDMIITGSEVISCH